MTNEKRAFSGLANAVILQAVKDYKAAGKKEHKEGKSKETDAVKREVENFFTSALFNVYSELNGKLLFEKVKHEVEHPKPKKKRTPRAKKTEATHL